jgi:putative ABC transport system permease protein
MKKQGDIPDPLAVWLLSSMTREDQRESVVDDFAEICMEIKKDRGIHAARCWYWAQVLKSIPMFLRIQMSWGAAMFKNYLTITLRNLKRHKGYSLINTAGLILGFTIVLLITIYIRYEFSYDRFHENADSTYRVIQKAEEARSGSVWWNATPGLLKSTLLNECPDVENAARLCIWKSMWRVIQKQP